MSGILNLDKLLAELEPELDAKSYVFCTFPGGAYGDHAELRPVGCVFEDEGLTLIIPRSRADEQGIFYTAVLRRIILRVHSSLEAVGLTAAFAERLTRHGISANVLAGFYHDHVFVQADRAEDAVRALRELSAEAR